MQIKFFFLPSAAHSAQFKQGILKYEGIFKYAARETRRESQQVPGKSCLAGNRTAPVESKTPTERSHRAAAAGRARSKHWRTNVAAVGVAAAVDDDVYTNKYKGNRPLPQQE